jgi:hypothetical protein
MKTPAAATCMAASELVYGGTSLKETGRFLSGNRPDELPAPSGKISASGVGGVFGSLPPGGDLQ